MRALALLAVLGLLVRAIVPAGYMVAATGGHGAAVVMCSGHAMPAHPQGEPKRDSGKHHDAPCLFAASAIQAAHHNAPALTELERREEPAALSRLTAIVSPKAAAQPPPARGPPAFT